MKFDHIGVTSTTLASGRTLLESSIGIQRWTQEWDDPVNDVWVQFGHDGSGICYELVAPRSERSPILRVLSKRVNVLNHVAYLVDNLTLQAQRLITAGFVQVGAARPAIAYGNKPIQFLVSETRLLIELIEAPIHQHSYVRTA